jgi:putative transcriptional regulator
MRKKIKDALGDTVQDMLKSGLKTSFTKKELKTLGIDIPEIRLTSDQIKAIREKRNCSQTVFAKLLNVSPSSVRQWEQGKRIPTGSTMVLLELLEKSPHILDYRINAH